MACLGNVTAAATLAMVWEGTEAELHSALGPAIRADLVLLQAGDYQLMHDRIHEAAYGLHPGSRAGVHASADRQIARPANRAGTARRRYLRDRQSARCRCGAVLIRSEEERRQVAALNLIAGKRAKAGTAYVSALRYLSAGRALLPADAWDRLPADLGSRAELGRMRVPDR